MHVHAHAAIMGLLAVNLSRSLAEAESPIIFVSSQPSLTRRPLASPAYPSPALLGTSFCSSPHGSQKAQPCSFFFLFLILKSLLYTASRTCWVPDDPPLFRLDKSLERHTKPDYRASTRPSSQCLPTNSHSWTLYALLPIFPSPLEAQTASCAGMMTRADLVTPLLTAGEHPGTAQAALGSRGRARRQVRRYRRRSGPRCHQLDLVDPRVGPVKAACAYPAAARHRHAQLYIRARAGLVHPQQGPDRPRRGRCLVCHLQDCQAHKVVPQDEEGQAGRKWRQARGHRHCWLAELALD